MKVRVGLHLTVPVAQEKLYFDLDLLSTPNNDDKGKPFSADEAADYVWIRPINTSFSSTVQGKIFKLQLRFGPSERSRSFTTIDTFHVHEGKSATGKLYGSLVPAL